MQQLPSYGRKMSTAHQSRGHRLFGQALYRQRVGFNDLVRAGERVPDVCAAFTWPRPSTVAGHVAHYFELRAAQV